VGYNQAGEWLEYTVKVASTGTYTMNASVASANNTSSFKLSMDGKDITEEIAVPAATAGEDNYDEYNEVKASVSLTEGEHILRFTVTGDWMDIDYIKFCAGESCEESMGLRTAIPTTVRNTSAPRLIKKGNALFIEKSGKRFDLTGHRIK
jgi:alpha-galactosidase